MLVTGSQEHGSLLPVRSRAILLTRILLRAQAHCPAVDGPVIPGFAARN